MPLQRSQIHQHRAAGVRDIGRVHAAPGAAGEVPQQPAVHRPERELAVLGPLAGAGDVVEQPGDLRPREVGRQRQADSLAQAIGARLAAPARARARAVRVSCQTIALCDRLAARAVPHDRRLALVGDADRRNVVGLGAGARERPADHLAGAAAIPPRRRARPSPPRGGSARARAAPPRRSSPSRSNRISACSSSPGRSPPRTRSCRPHPTPASPDRGPGRRREYLPPGARSLADADRVRRTRPPGSARRRHGHPGDGHHARPTARDHDAGDDHARDDHHAHADPRSAAEAVAVSDRRAVAATGPTPTAKAPPGGRWRSGSTTDRRPTRRPS